MRTVREAMAYINQQIRIGAYIPEGMCKKEVGTEAYGIPSDGTPDATSAWHVTTHRFHGAWVWGGLVYWTGGTHGHGHVAIMRWRKGRIKSTDFPRTSRWNNTTIAELEKAWPELVFAGTALDINGHAVRKMPRVIRRWSHP